MAQLLGRVMLLFTQPYATAPFSAKVSSRFPPRLAFLLSVFKAPGVYSRIPLLLFAQAADFLPGVLLLPI